MASITKKEDITPAQRYTQWRDVTQSVMFMNMTFHKYVVAHPFFAQLDEDDPLRRRASQTLGKLLRIYTALDALKLQPPTPELDKVPAEELMAELARRVKGD